MEVKAASTRIEELLDEIHHIYWCACDHKQAALDPEKDLRLSGPVVKLLADAFDVASRVEEMAKNDGTSWGEARSYF